MSDFQTNNHYYTVHSGKGEEGGNVDLTLFSFYHLESADVVHAVLLYLILD